MYESHPIFELPADHDIQIWRYMDFTKFVAMLESDSLWFARADCLRDPFEAAYTKPMVEKYVVAKGMTKEQEKWWKLLNKVVLYEAKQRIESFYVNCWHINSCESAAIWKLYLKSDEGLAIQSTRSPPPPHHTNPLPLHHSYFSPFNPLPPPSSPRSLSHLPSPSLLSRSLFSSSPPPPPPPPPPLPTPRASPPPPPPPPPPPRPPAPPPISRLIESANKSGEKILIGKVRYIDYNNAIFDDTNYYNQIIHKIKSYEYENELRAMIVKGAEPRRYVETKYGREYMLFPEFDFKNHSCGIYACNNMNDLIERIYVAPNSRAWFSDLVSTIAKKYKITCKIETSGLEDRPLW